MTLRELFTTHDVVPVQRSKAVLPDAAMNPIYINRDRASVAAGVTTSENSDVETPTWEVQPSEISSSWTVNGYSKTPKTIPTTNKENLYVGYGDLAKSNLGNRAKYWMNLYSNLGLNQGQQIALVSAMIGECGLNPKGAVEKRELAGEGNTKAGWAHAGEGAIGFTTWSTKKQFIEMYNNDPRRQGPKLATNETEYNKESSRHIADLNDQDQALITYHFYKNLLNKNSYNSFEDLIADFYLQKAGRGFGKGAGRNASLYNQALYTGTVYQKSHEKLGYTKAAQTNTFERTMGWAHELADLVGYQYS